MDRGVDGDGAAVKRYNQKRGSLGSSGKFGHGHTHADGRAIRLAPLLMMGVLLAFLSLFYFYPVASILSLSFTPMGHGGGEGLSAVLKPHALRVIWFTTWQAALSTVLTLVVAMPGAYIFARYEFPGKSLLQALTTVPFVLPTIVVSLAFTSLFGPHGWLNVVLMNVLGLDRPPLNFQYTLGIILLAHVFYNYTLVLRLVGTQWAYLDPRLEEAARVLGAGRWRAFREITLPLLAPTVGAAALLVFLFCFTSFGVILVLGGPRFATLEVEIYLQTVHYLNLPVAAALSVLQILCTLGMMSAYTFLQARVARPVTLRSRRMTQRPVRKTSQKLMVGVNLAAMVVLLMGPLFALAARSVTLAAPGGGAGGPLLSFGFYRRLFENPRGSVFYVPPIAAVRNSVGFALTTMVLAVALGGMAATVLVGRGRTSRSRRARRWLDVILMLPLGTSAVTLGLGYIVALDEPPLNLRTSPWLVVFAHTLVALPFVVRSVLPALRAIDPRLRETAAVLGASPGRVWREVDLPIVARAVLVGAVFAFTVSMGEFGATSLIARPERPTMPIAIYRFLARPGAANYGQALAMSTLLMLVCTLGFVMIERFRIGEVGEF